MSIEDDAVPQEIDPAYTTDRTKYPAPHVARSVVREIRTIYGMVFFIWGIVVFQFVLFLGCLVIWVWKT